MTDLELLDEYVDKGTNFIDPRLFRKVKKRGLLYLVDGLPQNGKEAKAILRARLAKEGKTFGDAEIDNIAAVIKRLEDLRDKLDSVNMADSHKALPIIEEMKGLSERVKNYYT